MRQKTISLFFLILFAFSLLAGCAPAAPTATSAATAAEAAVVNTVVPTDASSATEVTTDTSKDDAYAEALTFNNSAWNYDADKDVYWQIGSNMPPNRKRPIMKPWGSMCPASI